MKFKSKLIATIVSICTAIAVMGIGVWAAVSTFKTSISNTVGLSFDNLHGEISVTAETGADNLGLDETAPTLNKTVLYNAGTTIYDKISSEATSGTNLYWEGTTFLDSTNQGMKMIDQSTKAGAIAYTFTYTPSPENVGQSTIYVMVTETGTPAISGAILLTAYFVSTDGTHWTEFSSGTAVTPAKDNESVQVLAICQYHNPEGKSVTNIATAWNFDVTFTAGDGEKTALSGTNTFDGIEDGVILPVNFVPNAGAASIYEDVLLSSTTPQQIKVACSELESSGNYFMVINLSYTPVEIEMEDPSHHLVLFLDILVDGSPIVENSSWAQEALYGHYGSVDDAYAGTAEECPMDTFIDQESSARRFLFLPEAFDSRYLVDGKYNFCFIFRADEELPNVIECTAQHVVVNESLEFLSTLPSDTGMIAKSLK